MGKSKDEAKEYFIKIIESRMKNSRKFICYEYFIQKSLRMKEHNKNKALVTYYEKIEKKKSLNLLEEPKFEILYQQILQNLAKNPNDKEEIKFIHF